MNNQCFQEELLAVVVKSNFDFHKKADRTHDANQKLSGLVIFSNPAQCPR
jgi:hypothetical protein